jgi:hypothetical protein
MSDLLLAGQAQGGELWYLAEDSFGQEGTVGTQRWLRYRSQPYAPAGPTAQTTFRRAYVPLAYEGSCALLLTPVVDFQLAQPPLAVSFGLPTNRQLRVVAVPIDKLGTYIAMLVQVTAATGRVEVFTPAYAHDPVTPAAMTPTGPT